MWDIAVVGAGPGGMQAAISAASEGLKVLVLEKDKPGGQIGQTPLLENSVFASGGVTGPEFARMMRKQCEQMGAEFRKGQALSLYAHPTDGRKALVVDTLTDESTATIRAAVVVLACGNKWTEINIPGIKEAVGKTVHYGPVRCIDYNATGRDVAVCGGGPSAGQAILALADASNTRIVHAVMRSTLKMPQYLVDRITRHPKVRVVEHAKIEEVRYRGLGDTTAVFVGTKYKVEWLEVDALFMCNGLVPNTGWLQGILPPTDYGQIVVEGNVQTKLPGVYAIGDCREGSTPRIGSAIGDGSLAITEAWRYLKANPALCSRPELVGAA